MKKVILILCLAVLTVSACSRQQSDWEKTRAANTTDAYELFLKKYPNGEFTAQAQARVKDLYEERDWQKARDIDTAEAYQAFVKQYPEGKWPEEARIRIENFTLAAAPSSVATANSVASPPADTPASDPEPALPPASYKAGNKRPAKAVTAVVARSAPRSGKYGVQLGAFKSSENAANNHWSVLSGKYPTLLSGLTPQVSTANGTTETLYRLRVVDLSGKRARAICKTLKSHSQACEVVRPAL